MSSSSPPPPVREIYEQAIALEDEAARESLIADRCQGDRALRERVERLLSARAKPSNNLLQKALAYRADDADLAETQLTKRSSIDRSSESDTGTSSPNDTHFDPPSIPSYRLAKVIGEGGMGTVYLAEQTEPVRREVALKVIKPGMDSREVIARFEAERQALAMMDHPNIAKVLDGGATDQGRPYFVMELVRGVPITRYCREQNLGLRDRLLLFVDLCHAVHHAHQRGIIHRDLKPSNILVTEHDKEPVVKVIDFGVAKALRGELTDRTLLTQCSQMLGTPLYMSPEQAVRSDLDVDTRTDIFSLGVLFYELLTGTTPIERQSYARMGDETFGSLLTKQDPQRPSERVSKLEHRSESDTATASVVFGSKLLKRELDWIVMKAIERDRERRYSSASELADDVRRYLDGEAVEACPPSWLYRVRKTAAYHRVELGVLTFVISALIVVAIVSQWQMSAVEAARQQSEIRERRAVHLLQAFKLQSALTTFRDENLVRLREMTDQWNSDAILNSGATAPSQIVELLTAVAHRPPNQTFTNSSGIHDLAVLRNNKGVVSVDEQGDVKFWRIEKEGSDARLIGSHGEPAHAVAVSPDGTKAVTGSQSGQICFWNLKDGTLIRKLQPVGSGVETLRWSADGRTIAAGARYSEVWVCDADGNERFRIPNDHRHESLLFSRDSSELVVPTRVDVVVYDAKSGKELRHISTDPTENVRTMCFAGDDEKWLVVGERFKESLAILDYARGQLVGQVSLGASYPRSLCVSQNGWWMRASYTDGRIQLIQLSPRNGGRDATGRVVSQFVAHEAKEDERLPLVSHRGNNSFVSAGQDGRIYRWNQQVVRAVEVRRRPESIVKSYLLPESGDIHHYHRPKIDAAHHEADVFSATIVGDQFAGASDNFIWVFRTNDQLPLAQLRSPLNEIQHIGLGDGGNQLLASSGSSICVWETNDGWNRSDLRNRIEIEHHAAPIFADGGKSIIVDDARGNRVLSIEIQSGQRRVVVDEVDPSFLCLDPTEKHLGIVTDDGFLVVDRGTREVILRQQGAEKSGALRFNDDGTILLEVSRDTSVDLWYLPTRQRLGTLYAPEVSSGWPIETHLSSGKPRLMLEIGSDYGGVYLLVIPGRTDGSSTSNE